MGKFCVSLNRSNEGKSMYLFSDDLFWGCKYYAARAKKASKPFEIIASNTSCVFYAGSFLEAYIIDIKDSFEVFQVLERSSVNISGISAEQVVYAYDEFSVRNPLPDAPLKGTPSGSSLIWVGRAIFFDHDGLVWFIRMKSIEEAAEKTKLDFEHLIETFRILK